MKLFSPNAIFDGKEVQTLIQPRNKDKLWRRGPKCRQLPYPDPFEQPRVVIQWLRSAVSALLYMQASEVNKIFIAQVNRICTQLKIQEKALRKNLEKARRDKSGTDNVSQDHVVTCEPRQPQKLEEKMVQLHGSGL